MTIHIWSDIVCPFCYIGKRHLEQALKQVEHSNEVTLVWHSYQLDPDLVPVTGQSLFESLSERKGWSIEQTREISADVIAMAKEAGLHYDFDKVIPANTFSAHQLIHLSTSFGLQNEMEERLFAAYFIDGLDIGNHEVLKQIGVKVGIPAARIDEAQNGNEFADAVRNDIQMASKIGVRGVPFFLFENSIGISGAQPVESFVAAIEKASKT